MAQRVAQYLRLYSCLFQTTVGWGVVHVGEGNGGNYPDYVVDVFVIAVVLLAVAVLMICDFCSDCCS